MGQMANPVPSWAESNALTRPHAGGTVFCDISDRLSGYIAKTFDESESFPPHRPMVPSVAPFVDPVAAFGHRQSKLSASIPAQDVLHLTHARHPCQ